MPTPAWHIVTGEYAPAPGGVADYSRSVARALVEAGDEVHVWAPGLPGSLMEDAGVSVHPLPGTYGARALSALSRALRRERTPQRVLIQYVPHAFGMKAMNLPFCLWVAALRGPQVWVMFHEVALPWANVRRWKANVGSVVTRSMAALIAGRADRVFMSIPGWEPLLQSLAPRWRGATWLPIPSNIPTSAVPAAVASLRTRLGIRDGAEVVGHFGTYGPLIAESLGPVLERLLRAEPRRIAVLVGRGSDTFARTLSADPQIARRVLSTGDLEPQEIATHLRACDVLIQPYPDGVSSRRTSVMAGLALGIPIATNEGRLSEAVWRQSAGVQLATSADGLAEGAEVLLRDRALAGRLADRGRALYETTFSLKRTIATLRGSDLPGPAA